jgi:hypothetical protein
MVGLVNYVKQYGDSVDWDMPFLSEEQLDLFLMQGPARYPSKERFVRGSFSVLVKIIQKEIPRLCDAVQFVRDYAIDIGGGWYELRTN